MTGTNPRDTLAEHPRTFVLPGQDGSRGSGTLTVALLFALAVTGCSSPSASHGASSATSLPAPDPAALQADADNVGLAIRASIDTRDPTLDVEETRQEWDALQALYQPGGYSPLWTDLSGRPDRDAQAARDLLNAAADEGLDPSDYYLEPRERLTALLEAETPASLKDRARFDVTLSSGMLRYFRNLHLGQIDPRTIGLRFDPPPDPHDFVALLRSALAEHRIPEAAVELGSPWAQYDALRAMLARYRTLAADAALEIPPPLAAAVRPGQAYDGAGHLYRQLLAFGDLPADTQPPPDLARYEGSLVDGVKRFQVRHGIEPDGVIGKRTLAALRVPLSWRVRQIELALERLRWLPDLGGQRLIIINIPMFRLWAWNSLPPSSSPSFGMNVIVGRALNTRTPVFVEKMRDVELRPYWNIPLSILRNETLPKIERDPDYLDREQMEIVRGDGDDAQPEAVTDEAIAQLRQGTLRVRQRPGPGNALGLVKFVFPNDENVYMHGTPAQELFARNRRDFSHGCVRLEDPIALAEWVLADQPEWTRERILAGMAGSRTVRVTLKSPVQVILFYSTAAVIPEDGTMGFADDIYGQDALLDRALAARSSASQKDP
jgi:L,D-transpeptidase YcbB